MGSDDAGGYGHAQYAASLAEWGLPRHLAGAGSWALERRIDGSDLIDATGCYPVMACHSWNALEMELEARAAVWVSFTAVPDPLLAPPESQLRRIFRDVVRPFKTHYVIELGRWTGPLRAQHRAQLRQAARHIETEVSVPRRDLLVTWNDLYGELVTRHSIPRTRVLSPQSFNTLFDVPGLYVARSTADGETVAMSLWMTNGGCGYYHLSASTTRGYAMRAAYPMVQSALSFLKNRGLELVDLGGAAGTMTRPDDGLAKFKRGWSNGERTAWLCGRILDAAAYRALGTHISGDYFPAYRDPVAQGES